MDDAFDFSSLTATDVAGEPEHTGGKPKKYEHNPFVGWLSEAIKKGGGKEVQIPPKAVKDSLMLARDAAAELKIGLRINLFAKGKRIRQSDVAELAPNVKVTFKVWPAPKRPYAPRTSQADLDAPETPAE